MEELRASAPRLAFAATGGPLLRRVRRLLGSAGEDRPASAREICGLALLGMGLVLVIAGICLSMAAPTYQAVARMKLERDAPAQLSSNDGRGPSLTSYDPYLIQTEFEVLQSDFVLSRVATELKLDQEWGKRHADGKPLKMQEAVAMLRARLALRPVRNTSLVEIRVSSDNPSEAAQIANAIAAGYRTHRLEQRRQTSLGGVEVLEQRFKKQEKEIEEQEEKVSRLREELQIPDAIVNAGGPAFLLSAETLRKIEAQRIQNLADLIRQETMVNELRELSWDDMVQTLPKAVPDALLSSLIERWITAEEDLVGMKKEFGPQHHEIIKATSQVADLKDKIKKRVDGIILAFDAKVSASRKSLEGLNAEVQSATTKDLAMARQSQPYYDAKHRLEQLQRFGQMLTFKIASEKIDMDLPKTGTVEIVDQAEVPSRPVSPNLYRAVSCCTLGLLLALIGIVMVKMALRRAYSAAQPG